MKKKNFFRNCNAGRMLLVIVCLAALFASPQRAWADDDKVSVTIDGNTTKYGIVDEAMIAVNAATSNVTVKLLTDVELVVNSDPQHLQYGYIRFTNTNPVTEESGTRPVTSHGHLGMVYVPQRTCQSNFRCWSYDLFPGHSTPAYHYRMHP